MGTVTKVAAIQVAELNADVARRYGWLRAHLNTTRPPIVPNDLWIAAHGLALELPLISRKLDDFQHP